MCVYKYMYIYIYIHMYICINTYIYEPLQGHDALLDRGVGT